MIFGDFWDQEVWSFIITLAILLVSLLVANLLRRYIKPLRKLMIPSPVLAGFLVLLVNWGFKAIFKQSMFAPLTLEALTYHGLGLGFVALALKSVDKKPDKQQSVDVLNTGLTVVSSYLIQAVVGLAITLGLSYFIADIFPASGLILPMGYGQGPGQAFIWGKNYEDLGMVGGTSFGLTVAAMGFISASIGGAIYLTGLKKKGKIKEIGANEDKENLSAEMVTTKDEIPLSESMDKLTVQIALVVSAYIITYLIMFGLYQLFLLSGNEFLLTTVNSLIWGFNFLIGTVVAMILRNILNKLYKKGVMKRKYTNNFLLNRVSGLMFDLMVVASIAAIDLSAFTKIEFILPLSLICIAGAFVTYFHNKYVCKVIFKDYSDEAFLALYGMNTGTASTGVILLREIDPQMLTPASSNIVFQSLYAIVFGFPMLLLLGFAPRTDLGTNGWAWLTLVICILLLAGMTITLFRKQIFKKKISIDKK